MAMNIEGGRFISLSMEKESIAYFYLQCGKIAKDGIFSEVVMEEKRIERDGIRIDAVGIPEFYCEKLNIGNLFGKKFRRWRKGKEGSAERADGTRKEWKEEDLGKELEARLQRSGAQWCWYGEGTAKFLGVKQPETPLFLMEEMLSRYGVRERVLLIGEPNPLFDMVFREFMPKVNYLQISCDEPEYYEKTAEWLYGTFGIVTVFQRQGVNITGNGQAQMLVIDMGQGERANFTVQELPENCIYMDMASKAEKKEWIKKRRRDIRYLSPESVLNKWCHLDTNA